MDVHLLGLVIAKEINMFLFHIALSLDLIAVAAGAALIVRTKQAEGCCS